MREGLHHLVQTGGGRSLRHGVTKQFYIALHEEEATWADFVNDGLKPDHAYGYASKAEEKT